MFKSNKKHLLTITLLIASISGAMAHTSLLKKNTPDKFSDRSELEGTSSVLNHLNIPHGCSAPGSSAAKSVRAVSLLFPNGSEATAQRNDTNEAIELADIIEGNAIMSARPVQDHNIFEEISTFKGPVPTFNRHGERSEDTRAFHYGEGKIDLELVGLIPFRSSFPKFKKESCITQLRVNFAIANYCTRSQNDDNRADIWIGFLTERFNDPDVVSTGFWPHTNIVRDTLRNPLPSNCGDGYTATVSPSAASIDRYLPIQGYWPAGKREHSHRK